MSQAAEKAPRPETPAKGMNIYQKMLEATSRINRVAKNLRVGAGQGTYKAVGEADVLEAVKPVEAELGIYSFPFSRQVVEANAFTTKSEYNGKVTEKTALFLRVETVYRFVNVDDPSEFVDIKAYGDGVDPQDKAPGKAMTYSDKYALLKAYKIETGDDPDQKASEPMGPAWKSGAPEGERPGKPIDTPEDTQAEIDRIKGRPINKVQAASIRAELERTGVREPRITGQYRVDGLEGLNFQQWTEIMDRLGKVPTKKKSDLPL
jgi:hypothetical protein